MNIEAYAKRRTQIKKLIKITTNRDFKISFEWLLLGYEEALKCLTEVDLDPKFSKERKQHLTKPPREN
jgi:hypothetical protein